MEVMPGYKRTEVGVIPRDWNLIPLAALASMKSGESITSANIDQFSKYPCYGGNGLRGFTTRFTHNGHYALIGRQGALCGNVLGVEGQFFASEHAIVVTPCSGTDIQWLTFVLGEMRLNRLSESSAQPGLSVAKVLRIGVAAPPTRGEQAAISGTLGDVEGLIGTLERLIAKKRDLKQAAMQQLLTGKTRLPGFSGEWEVKRLGTLLRFQVGYPFSSVFFNRDDHGYRLIKNRDLRSEDQVFNYFGPFDSSYLVQDGDVLIGMDGDFMPCIWNKGPALLNQRVGRILAFPSLDKIFSYYMLIKSLKAIEAITSSTTVKHLSHGDIENIEEAIPDVTEQTAIAAVLTDMDAELAALEARREKTLALKQGMMQELLTGRTRLL